MKKLVGYSILILFVLAIALFVADYFVRKKVKTKLAEQSLISYKELQINTFLGNFSLEGVQFDNGNQNVEVKELDVNVDILAYLQQDEIKIKSVNAENVNLDLTRSTENENGSSSIDFDTLNISKIRLKNVKLSLSNKSKELFKASNLNLQAKNVSWPLKSNYQWIKNSTLEVDANQLRYDLGDLHFLKIGNFTFGDNSLSLTDFTIQPKYSKSDYVNHIKTEKDLINLKTSSLKITDFDLEKQEDKKLLLRIPQVQINDSDINIYRDKTVTDDRSFKPLYSQALRKLGFQLQVDSISLSSSDLTYQELLSKNEKACEIKFNSFKGQITNLHNSIGTANPKIKAVFKGEFTPGSMIDFRMNFVPDHERFYVSTFLKNVKDQAVNGFFKPAMNLKMDGKIDEIKTSFSGNNSKVSGDFTMAYNNLKIDILKKDGTKNDFASFVGNIFVENNDKEDTIKIDNLKRYKTKSFWNYIWSFHREGLKKAML